MDEPSRPTWHVGWVFLFALKRESAPFMRRFDMLLPPRFADHPPCPIWRLTTGREQLFVLETGVGATRAASAARWVMEYCSPRLVVACGFAGSLDPSLAVGDVLLASEVVESDDLH